MKKPWAALLTIACGSIAGAQVLWDQSELVQYIGNPPLVCNQEFPPPDRFGDWSSYILTDIDTGGDSWVVHEVTVYFTNFNANYGGRSLWLGVLQQARLSVLSKTDPLPPQAFDPRTGQVVDVTVAEIDVNGVLALAVTASGLDVPLDAGAYWVGLTPLVPLESLGYYQEVHIPSARSGDESAWRNPAGAFGAGTNWTTVAAGPAPDWWIDFDAAITIRGSVGGCEPCDANCDGAINAFDIEPFIDVLFNGRPPCSDCAADVNGDGRRDAFDIEPFVSCLFGP